MTPDTQSLYSARYALPGERPGGIVEKMPTRKQSPSTLIRNKVLERYKCDPKQHDAPSPVERVYPPGLVEMVKAASGMTRNRVYRWLNHPAKFEPTWTELVSIAEEIGGNLRCMFSVKHS